MTTGATIDVDPADALADTTIEHAFDTAKHAFTERIHTLQSAGLGDDWATSPLRPDTGPGTGPLFTAATKPADDTVISLHMAALADVLATLNDDFARYDNPMDVLIAHEVSYWRRIVEARGEYFDENLMRTLVAVQAVTGAKKLNNAQAAVTAGFDVHHSGFPDAAPNDRRLLAAYEDILTAAYPSGNGAHWGSMGPDLLSTALVAEVEDKSGGQFIERLLPHPYLDEDQQHRALTVLARSAPASPRSPPASARAIAAAPTSSCPSRPEPSPPNSTPTSPGTGCSACRTPSPNGHSNRTPTRTSTPGPPTWSARPSPMSKPASTTTSTPPSGSHHRTSPKRSRGPTTAWRPTGMRRTKPIPTGTWRTTATSTKGTGRRRPTETTILTTPPSPQQAPTRPPHAPPWSFTRSRAGPHGPPSPPSRSRTWASWPS
ncbi:hypothetical protein O1M63_18475 [Streptomyces mirabilis]|nr:hypothetical protein [Streptomyces mirabilis]